jgi:phosphotransferase system HPr (HPr) family protein
MPASSEAERVVTLPAGIDLHARPAAQLVRTAVGFSAQITVAVDGREANAKSLLDVLALGATAGTPLRLAARGQDADVALDALDECVAAFG